MMSEETIRHIVIEYIKSSYKDSLIINELGLCEHSSRIDIAVVNTLLNGFEIKSDFDTLSRLPNQIETYNKIFDTVSIACGETLLPDIIKIIPSWWGVLLIKENNIDITQSCQFNKDVNAYALSQLLWRKEVIKILRNMGLKNIQNKTRDVLWKILSDNISVDEIKGYVIDALKTRKTGGKNILC